MRCPVHDLALGPDGQCVLCRREQSASARVPRWMFVVAGLTLVVLAGIFVAKSLPAPPTPEPVAAISAVAPAAVVVAPRENPEPTPAFLRKVERVDPPTPHPTPATGVAEAARPAPPTADDLRAALKEVPITMYSTSWCPHCVRARRWFRSNSISFVEYDVEENAAAKRAQRKLNPAGGVPTIDIDGVVEVGFSEQRVGKAIAQSVQRRLRATRP